MVNFLLTHKANFAFNTLDVLGINLQKIAHRLQVNPNFPSIQQKKRNFWGEDIMQ